MISPPAALITEARSHLSTPWAHQRADKFAMDCKGLIVLSALAVGWEPRDLARVKRLNYRREASDELRATMANEGQEVTRDELRPGDAVLFHFPGAQFPHHMGLITEEKDGQLFVIHSSNDVGYVIEHVLDGEYLDALVCGFRVWEFC